MRICMPGKVPSKESIIEHINLILTDRVDQKQQLIAEINQTKIQHFDDIIKTLETFIIKNNSTLFSFFSTSRLQKQLSILVDGLKTVKQQHESKVIESKKYQQYLQHDKRLDQIIKTILEYSPSRRDVETLKLIGKDFENVVEKLKAFFCDREIKAGRSETSKKEAKIDKLLEPIKDSKDGIINAFLQLAQLRFYQFITSGLLNLKAGDIHKCYFEDICDAKTCFSPVMFEFHSEREELLKELFHIEGLKEAHSDNPDKQSQINASLMFAQLIKEGNDKSVHFDWLSQKIMLLTNTESRINKEDLIRAAHAAQLEIEPPNSCCC